LRAPPAGSSDAPDNQRAEAINDGAPAWLDEGRRIVLDDQCRAIDRHVRAKCQRE